MLLPSPLPAPHDTETKTISFREGHASNGKSDFILMIENEYQARTKKNPRYSMRAFARDLKVSPSHLSRVLQKQTQLSLSTARMMVSRLEWVGPKANRFLVSVSEQGNDATQESKNPLLNSRPLTAEEFKRIAEWQHFAILELCEVENFVLNPLSVSHALGLSVAVATKAIDTLCELKLLKKTSRSGYRKVQAWVHTSGRGKTSEAHRLHQKSLLYKAIQNLDEVALEERANFGSMYAIDPTQIGEAKELINQFIVDLEKLLAGKKRTRVYAAGIFLTPLSIDIKDPLL